MKKIVYGAVVALYDLFIAPDVEVQAGMAGSAKETVTQGKFYPVKVADMPQVLCDAVNTSYEGCVVKPVKVSDNNTFAKYEVVSLSRNGKIYRVYFDDRGHVVKKHTCFE